MNYLIQNFYHVPFRTRITAKLRGVFLVRNVNLISFLLDMHVSEYAFLVLGKRIQLPFRHARPDFFNSLWYVITSHIRSLNYQPIGTTLPRSAYYLAIQRLHDLLTYKTVYSSPVVLEPKYDFEAPYYEPTQFMLANHSNKPYRLAVWKIMRMVTLLWFQWPKRYKLVEQHIFLTGSIHLLSFVNRYYFKIYNV